ncbi:Glyoxalase/Bleomycin resistance protein/Dioxygenase superfamily protein [Granulicella pectinivorans]|jgi:catechol 2,3-dioxygenase-like lactoylglutathione lyase family enzyme|uniref:Glyoxalase/Bleomycin resistance protein/Dioxygenase superfamily protein n=1 Tax=Granulicella pectinivorans TaxID=474950 RepID=A0A1I6MY38_9BACT|nr:VOC family protein [Granulicella pectinivorans]SFS20584.1 Glyoxalase/Bleomycin resistance protein/Dioxygenase superfamily protein [Granulicella pectinivorans]
MNTLLNHINLITTDVPALSHFFQAIFHFRVLTVRGKDELTVLEREGFILTLMLDKTVDGPTYPGIFHIGFLQATRAEVLELLHQLRAYGLDAPEPKLRSGNRFGFFVTAPGGILVEIGTMLSATEIAA